MGSDQGQIPRRGSWGAKQSDQKVILTDDFDRQLVNFENPVRRIDAPGGNILKHSICT